MAWYRAGGGGIPSSLKAEMNDVLNKKFGTFLQNYPPEGWPDNVNLLGPLPIKTASGAIASFSDGADDVPLKSGVFGIVPSGGGGTPSSPVPIVGRSGMTISHSGANLFPFPIADYWETGDINATTGETEPNEYNTRTKDFLPVSATTIYVSGVTNSGSSDKFRFFFYASDKSFISRTNYSNTASVTVPSNAVWFKMRYQTASGSFSNPSIFEQADQSYQPYTKTTRAVSFGSTVYGGEYSMDGGLTSDMALDTMTSSYLSGLSSDYIGYTASVPYFSNHPCVWVRNWNYPTAKGFVSGGIKCVCNAFPVSMNNTSIISTQYRIYFDVNGTGISSVQDFIDAVTAMEQGGDNLEIAYELATPTETEIDPTPINSRLGSNNLWCDTGDSEIEYYADINLALAQ